MTPDALRQLEALFHATKKADRIDAQVEAAHFRNRPPETLLERERRIQEQHELRAMRALLHWQPQSQAILFWRQTCTCGQVNLFSQGRMLLQKHDQDATASRLIPWTPGFEALPRETIFHDSHIEVCQACAGEWK